MGTLPPPPKRGTKQPPIYSAHVYCGQMAEWTKMLAWRYRPRPRRHCVRWGPSSLPKGAQRHRHFTAHVYCGQTAGWIKIPLCTEVGLVPGHIVLDGTQLFPRKGAQQPPLSVHFALARSPISAAAKHLYDLYLFYQCLGLVSI